MDLKTVVEKRRQLRAELYDQILAKVNEFEMTTGVAIGSIDIEISHAVAFGNQSDIPTVQNVTVELLWPK